jgi:hypothetical protein
MFNKSDIKLKEDKKHSPNLVDGPGKQNYSSTGEWMHTRVTKLLRTKNKHVKPPRKETRNLTRALVTRKIRKTTRRQQTGDLALTGIPFALCNEGD